MKTSVKSIMMSMALIGCLIFSASDAMAQGRGHSQGGSSGSNLNRNTATPHENRNTNSSVSGNTATPQVSRNTNVSTSRQDNQTTSSSSSSFIRKGDATARPGGSTQGGSGGNVKPDNGGRPGNGGKPSGGGKPGGGGSSGGGTPSGGGSPGGGGTPGGGTPGGGGSPGGGTPGGGGSPGGGIPGGGIPGGGIPGGGGPGMPPPPNDDGPGMPPPPNDDGPGMPPPPKELIIGFGPMNPYDYSYHHYSDEFSWNYEHHNWSSSLPPLSRPDRPSFRGWFRPVIPAGWHANVGAPFIDGILGIPFGTFFDDALDYLYSQGFYIDGYANSIIYLRNVPMLRMIWDDVMLAFDTQGRLVNAEFVINTCTNITHHLQPKCWSHYGSQCRNVSNDNNGITPLRTVVSNNNGSDDYDKIYRRLCHVFGTPFNNSSGSVSLYGGNNTGWMTLLTFSNSGYHHTMLSIGY